MNNVCFQIAGMSICLESISSKINFTIPECHKKFVTDRPPSGGLHFQIQDGRLKNNNYWTPIYDSSEIWELWRDPFDRFIFKIPEISPPKRLIIVDRDFNQGKVIGEYYNDPNMALAPYPLENIEIKLFINWLANFGDIILHAVGVRINGRGYCFAGSSGSGKSTLAAILRDIPGVKILGEDNIVLRYINNQFWIFGTPWHLNIKMCSPREALLEKIFFLDRAIDPGIVDCDSTQGITRILQTAFIPYYRPESLPGILEKLNLLTTHAAFGITHYKLGSDPSLYFS